jgi:predicted Zn-dependent protease with MMP-like domain
VKRKRRERFDALLEQVLEALPQRLHELIEHAPIIVEDHPDPKLLIELGMDPDEESLCGLHTGIPLTEHSVSDAPDLPVMIHIFREGIIDEAGGWERWQDEDGRWWGGEDAIREEIRITVLHEIGHHFGLEEEDLEALGYE